MTTEKVSASLDRDVIEAVRKTVGPRGVSAFLTEAAREKLQRTRILAYLAELDAQYGPVSDEDQERADRLLARVLEP